MLLSVYNVNTSVTRGRVVKDQVGYYRMEGQPTRAFSSFGKTNDDTDSNQSHLVPGLTIQLAQACSLFTQSSLYSLCPIVTPEVVATKINSMKENKSPGVDGISPKILKETVEQISTPLAHVFNMSLQEGIVPLEWKEANIIPLFKNG